MKEKVRKKTDFGGDASKILPLSREGVGVILS